MNTTKLFIYGTLRKEAKSHIKPSKSLGLDSVQGKIYDINGHYPGFKHGKKKVIGEVVEIDEDKLNLIDAYEGDEYNRVKVTTTNGNEAWIYEYIPEIAKLKELLKDYDPPVTKLIKEEILKRKAKKELARQEEPLEI